MSLTKSPRCGLPAQGPTPTTVRLTMTTTIRHADLVESVAAALQYISYYHPADYITHLARAYESEASPERRTRSRRS